MTASTGWPNKFNSSKIIIITSHEIINAAAHFIDSQRLS